MAITPTELFTREPGQIFDYTGVGSAEIFNRGPMRRASQLSDEFLEDGDEGYGFTSRNTPETLFGQPETYNMVPRISRNEQQVQVSEEYYPSEEDYNAPVAASAPQPAPQAPVSGDVDVADFFASRMLKSEGRFDANGNLQVYTPPSGDGGGDYEVAGITQRYQPREAAQLRDLVNAGRNDEAVAYAKAFYQRRAAPFIGFTQNRGLQFQISDSVHHRGETGLQRILQRATGSSSGDYGELIRSLDSNPQALDAFHSARQAYEWEEVDRGRESRKKFRRGLQNRFNDADATARSLFTS